MYRLNWSLGDGTGITKLLAKNFTFTRLPGTDKEEILDKEGFKSFIDAFKAKAAENGGPPLGSHNFMYFKNIIQRLIGETTFETATVFDLDTIQKYSLVLYFSKCHGFVDYFMAFVKA